MKILLTGKNGQVGYELERSLQCHGEVMAVDRAGMDLADLDKVRAVIRATQPDVIVNAAAYTAVDQAESEPQLAMRINGDAPAVMAEEAKKLGAALVHYSTDYVFDGKSSKPYTETDAPSPLNVYGQTKLAGEQAITSAGIPYLILRTSWVYGTRGKNFLLTVQRLAKERKELRIVNDQHGSPTWSRTIAEMTAYIFSQINSSGLSAQNSANARKRLPDAWWEKSGIYHLTSQGNTTWFGFAKAVIGCANLGTPPVIHPIHTSEYPLPAKRPANSVLDCALLTKTFGGSLPSWGTALEMCVKG